ncbi:MAG: bifunctional DedA family/phosphatase PAP2 family protein [Thermoleophilaceae bacterium]
MKVTEHKKGLAAVALIASLAALYLTGVLPELPDPKKVIEDIARTLGGLTYVFVGALAFLETGAFVGLLVPGETTVIVGGVIAGQGEIDLLPLIGIVWVACVLGDTTSFLIGRRLGRGFILKHGSKVKIDEDRLEKVESYFERHGAVTIVAGRFVGLLRALTPFVAGSSAYPYRRFLPFSVIGCGAWVGLFSVLGFIFYRSFDQVAALAGQAVLGLGVTVALGVAAVLAYRRLRDPAQRRRMAGWLERQGRRPALRPVAAVLGPALSAAVPHLRFLRDRVPGELALGLTASLAVAGVGLYVFVLYASALGGGRRSTPADRELLGLADTLRSEPAIDAAKVVTDLGSFTTVAALVFGLGILLLARRRLGELAALITGSLIIYVAVRLAKEGIDRPRPAGPLETAEGSAFPSGHAAYSTVWVGVALVLGRVIPGIASDVALVGTALAIALVVGLTRIYLRVHYWSDVAGGWALGAAVLGACAAVGLVVSHIRNNAGDPVKAPVPDA